jgi:hypothetical protein
MVRTITARRMVLASVALAVVGGSALAIPPFARPPFKSDAADVVVVDRRPRVQVAILLDTSNSMDGLIFQARTQLWTIVNEFARAQRDGLRPRLQVALYEYGNNRLSPGEGYVRQVCGFTDDLDLLSERLWELTTNGGSEFCGTVIKNSVEELPWDRDGRTYKAVFIAGNEPFTQGQIDYREAVGRAIGKGIVINTIHCGTREDGVAGMWADGAKRGEGEFMWIDQDVRRRIPRCPQDDEIEILGRRLNETYLPYGIRGSEGFARQEAQDRVAMDNSAFGTAAERAVAKSSSAYDNSRWDLVDAVKDGKVKLEELKESDLPPALRDLPAGEREKYVQDQLARRQELAGQIQRLNADRARYLAEQEQRESGASETLDSAAVKTVRAQLRAKGFETE